MSEVVNVNPILKKIERLEKDLEELKLEVLRLQVEALPEEEIDDELYKEIMRKAEELESGKRKGVSAEEAVARLKAILIEKEKA